MRKDVMFRGCTRPAMFLGVPYVPFFIGAGGTLLFAMWFGLQFLLLVPLVIFAMRQMARRDELIFRVLGLRWSMRLRIRNVDRHERLWVLTPNRYRGQPERRNGN
ncbi:MAG: type IV secretion system protein VirB3 [Lysobacteraceae bacterium]|jgi:type IV secretion system protein VirB3|nr:VirB3 family type IV secretion system protein [Xanthomonadaceae bacterium]MCZ8317939.1 VirB3 family type IV secretion system protein [Silanimonas sp.]